MRFARHAISIAAIGLLAGCAHGAGSGAQPAPAPGPEDEVLLDVTNNTWSDLDVFVYAGTNRARVGTVVSMGTSHVSLSPNILGSGSVQIRAEPIGHGTPFTSDPIDVQRGERIRLTVEHQVSNSSWVVERTGEGW
jgi:hypothetical protein